MYKDLFYFDIETTSKYKDIDDLKKYDERGYDLFVKKQKTMSEYSDDWKIPESHNLLGEGLDYLYQKKASIYPEFGKIICLSFAAFSDDKVQVRTIMDNDEEKLLLGVKKVFERVFVTNKKLCGFKVKEFDIPWLIRKMYKYNIQLPQPINFVGMKPWEMTLTDISELWKGTSKNGASLDETAYELDIESPKKIMSGENVHEFYWFKKDMDSIMDYCEGDVRCLIDIAKKLKL